MPSWAKNDRARRSGEGVERARVPDVRRDGLGAVTLDHRSQVRGDPADRVIPRRPLPAVSDAVLGVVQAIGVPMDVEGGDSFRAGEALAHRMVVVGANVHDLSVVDRGDQAARRLAHPAERAHLADLRARRSSLRSYTTMRRFELIGRRGKGSRDRAMRPEELGILSVRLAGVLGRRRLHGHAEF